MSGVVTGDAVVLGLQPARLPSRALALFIDLVAIWVAYLLISLGLALATASLDEAASMAISIVSFLLVLVGAPIAVETLTHGRSLGKLACGLRVVRDDGGPIRFRHALMRGAMGVVEILMTFGVIACIASLVSERGRRIGDVFAGTLVIRERVASAPNTAVPPPPPWLVGRFTAVDLSAVPDGLWLEIRQYLTRMTQLDPAIGRQLAERLADELVARTGTPPPPGVPAAAFLAGVVAERQARDARRAFGPTGGAVHGSAYGAAYGPAQASAYGPAQASAYGPAPHGPVYGSADGSAGGPVPGTVSGAVPGAPASGAGSAPLPVSPPAVAPAPEPGPPATGFAPPA